MTDEPELTPTEQEVRRLLADARHNEPMPDDVVARLDRVLTGLSQEPARVAPVTQLAARRRRAAKLLLAAACVVAVGVGIGQVVDMSSDSADEAGSPMSTADQDQGAAEKPAEESAGQSAEASEPGASADRRTQVVEMDARALSATASALQDEYVAPGDHVLSSNGSMLTRSQAAAVSCAAEAWGKGTFVPVRYDGVPGVLVFRRAVGDTQVADLYLCGSTRPERSITLPAP